MRHVGNLCHRHDLPAPVHHMGHVDQPGSRRNRSLVAFHNCLVILYRKVEADLLVNDSLPLGALLIRFDHVRIVLFRADHLIAGLQRQPEDDRIQRLR